MKVSILRYAAIGMASLSLAGMAAASTVSLSTTGPNSMNKVTLTNKNTETTTNRNWAGVANFSGQRADTGNVDAHYNTTVSGDLSSGAAVNHNATDTSVKFSNTAPTPGAGAAMFGGTGVSFDTTGTGSTNEVKVDNTNTVKTTNTNNVEICNFNLQSASSGNVTASYNTKVGGLSSGDASNTNSTTTSVDISNQ